MEPAEEPEFVSAEDWKQRERRNILAALKRADWRIYGPGGAAELLGLKPTTLTSRMKAMKIKRASNKKGE
jgi:transcriptional regulator with GAF, ATPase, and Fis domain